MIRFNHVTKTYKGPIAALRDVTVDIPRGEFVFIVGPSGSGKTTFLRLVTKEERTVYENVAFALEVIGRSRHFVRSQVPQILELVGLGEKMDRRPNELSGGEQQRVAVARAFVNRPLILLADEPTGNLDPGTTAGIMRLLERINQYGTTVVMATHQQDVVDAMRKRVIELDQGQVVRDQARGVYGMVDA